MHSLFLYNVRLAAYDQHLVDYVEGPQLEWDKHLAPCVFSFQIQVGWNLQKSLGKESELTN